MSDVWNFLSANFRRPCPREYVVSEGTPYPVNLDEAFGFLELVDVRELAGRSRSSGTTSRSAA